jgi:hypothetical protein
VIPTCLINLSAAHAKAPGVLDRVFGKDGDFEGAPLFTGPCWSAQRRSYVHVGAEYAPATYHGARNDCAGLPALDREDLFLDPRVPTVGARIAWLCALAIDPRATSAYADVGPNGFTLHCTLPWGSATAYYWNHSGHTYSTRGPSLDRYFPGYTSYTAADFLAALFMELAPLIAALEVYR